MQENRSGKARLADADRRETEFLVKVGETHDQTGQPSKRLKVTSDSTAVSADVDDGVEPHHPSSSSSSTDRPMEVGNPKRSLEEADAEMDGTI